MLLVSVPASILPHIKVGGFLNNLMPVVFLAGGCTLILCADLVNGLARSRPRASTAALAVLLAGAAGWLIVKRYDPRPFVVTAERRRKAVALNQLVRSLEGGVIFPEHPFLVARNGVAIPQIHAMAYWYGWAAGLGTDINAAIYGSRARWLLWNTQAVGGNSMGPYQLVRKVEETVSMVGHPALIDALYRRP